MNIRIAGLGVCLLLAGGSLTTFASQAAAQTTVFDACYVDKTGVIYLIQRPGLPTDCIKPDKHIQFRWVDGEGADHGRLDGLAHNDHPQYLTRAGGLMTDTLGMNGYRIRHLGPGTEAGDAVPFEQAVKNGDAALGDLEGTYPDPTIASLQGNAVDAGTPASGQVLAWDGEAWRPTTPSVLPAVDVLTVSSTVHLEPLFVGEQILHCPAGFTSASGGWLLVSPGIGAWGELYGAGSFKVLDSWKWKFHNSSTTTTFEVLLEVYCLPNAD